jgi:hypothetical protein
MLYVIRQGFSVYINGLVYLGGQTVELSDVDFEQHKHKFENIPGSVLPSPQVNPSSNNVSSQIQISIQAEAWTDFAPVATVNSFQVLSQAKEDETPGVPPGARYVRDDLTDSFEYRQFNLQWQIRSLIAQNNLQIILNP